MAMMALEEMMLDKSMSEIKKMIPLEKMMALEEMMLDKLMSEIKKLKMMALEEMMLDKLMSEMKINQLKIMALDGNDNYCYLI